MIPFNNLKPLHEQLRGELDAASKRVLDSGWYILGPELEAFESAFAAYHQVRYAVGVANGTDAIELALRAAGIGMGDEVITVAHTAVATVCAIEQTGATPVLVDIDAASYTISVAAAEAAITPRTKAIIPVHIYGHPADVSGLRKLVDQHKLLLIEDCAQAHGARVDGQLVGTWGHMASFSFYPTKNLGAYGDGGAVITNDAGYAANLKKLRNYGQTNRYIHEERGINSRLDEIQAAILSVKLAHLDAHNAERNRLALFYKESLQDLNQVQLPLSPSNVKHVYHLYVVRVAGRDAIMESLKQQGVGTLIHYPVPVHLQQAYESLGYKKGSLPETERAAAEIVSLPMYIGLTTENIQTIGYALKTALSSKRNL